MKVLVIQHKMIGDVLTSAILFEVLRKAYPEARLEYLINSNTEPVILNNPYIDRIHSYLPLFDQDIKARNAFYHKLEEERFDIVIDVYAKLRSALLTRALKPKQSVSYRKWYTSFCYKKTVKPAVQTTTDEGLAITNRMLLLKALGLDITQIPKPKLYLSDREKQEAKALLTKAGIGTSEPVFMLSTFGSSDNKTYPLGYMALVLDFLAAKTNATLLLNYLPAQQIKVSELLQQCTTHTRTKIRTDIYGSSLREFLALSSHCDALIGNEGGAVNMAKALNIPTFSIFSPWILKSAWNSYEQDGFNGSIHLSDIHPELFRNHPKQYKSKAAELYQKLTPYHVNQHLQRFLEHHGLTASRP